MRFKSLVIGAAAIVGFVTITSMLTGCGNKAIGETANNASDATPDIEGNTGIDNVDDALNDQYVFGTEASLEGLSVTCPTGWIVSGLTDTRITVMQDDGDGRIDIELKEPASAEDAAAELLGSESDAGVGFTADNANEYVIGDNTWHGYEVEGGFAFEAEGIEGKIVSAIGNDVTVDESMEMLSGITIG